MRVEVLLYFKCGIRIQESMIVREIAARLVHCKMRNLHIGGKERNQPASYQ
jgi:hypothetical protein